MEIIWKCNGNNCTFGVTTQTTTKTKSKMNIIGFATEFYTLWDKQEEPIYFTDSYGKHWLQSIKENYFYIKNISTDIDKVKSLFPNTPIDDGLRGKARDFSITRETDLTPEMLKFGKYKGLTVQEVSEKDFSYILWLLENGRNETKLVCQQLPLVISHLIKEERERQNKIDAWRPLITGIHEVTFNCNPNGHIGESWIGQDWNTELVPFARMNYATVQVEENHTLHVIFPEVKYVDGMYPYYMGIINGKAKRVKNKNFTLNLEIIKTHKNEFNCQQFAIIK